MKQHAYLLMAFVHVITCDMLGMVVNVGSQENMINLYHSGQYMTHPQDQNIFVWEFTDEQVAWYIKR